MLQKILPRAFKKYQALPIFGSVADGFSGWCRRLGYSVRVLQYQLADLVHLDQFFHRRGLRHLEELTAQQLTFAVQRWKRPTPASGATLQRLHRYLHETRGLPLSATPPSTPTDRLLGVYRQFLQQTRGLADGTMEGHLHVVRVFLKFLGYEQSKAVLTHLSSRRVSAFVCQQARRHSPQSLINVIGALRSYLRFQHSQGLVSRPLHQLVEAPRIYRLANPPKAVPWSQVQALLASIDRSSLQGIRDYTLLYLIAAYGLRCGEAVNLKLDDIDWRTGVLRVAQNKTRQRLILPLTDQAGDILQRFLKMSRPSSKMRQLFFRCRPPLGPLTRSAVYMILKDRIRRSGLTINPRGPHALRHSFALQLLRQSVPLKAISDTLGHRRLDSTAIYLPLATEELREVAMPVPKLAAVSCPLPRSGWAHRIPRVRFHKGAYPPPPTHFRSGLAAPIQRYLSVKRALGRKYDLEKRTLLDLDDFLCEVRSGARKISRDLFGLWTRRLTALTPKVRSERTRMVRNFIQFQARDGAVPFVPEWKKLPKWQDRKTPRLVSEVEMARVLATAAGLPATWHDPLRSKTVRIALLLLFCCGLRLGELARLKLCDFDPQQETLWIENTKFSKSRFVPLSRSTADELCDYWAERRRHHFHFERDDFLIGAKGRNPSRPLVYKAMSLWFVWRQLCLATGLLDEKGRPPRLHDLRHSFIVNALQRQYELGNDAQSKLPHLANYVGHVEPSSTHYYLQMTPEIREAANHLFHQRFGAKLNHGGSL